MFANTYKDTFISYGRKESLAFAAKLHQQLRLKGLDAWFDKVNIPSGDDYVHRIQAGIRNAHNFVFVMAPHSLTSKNCLDELAYAVSLGKRIFPLNHIQETEEITNQYSEEQKLVRAKAAEILGNRDWLMGREKLGNLEALDKWKTAYENSWKEHENQAFLEKWECPIQWESIDKVEEVVEKFITVSKTDDDYVHQHTHLLYQALEWEGNQKQTKYLLVGKERQAAEEWLLTEFSHLKLPPCRPTGLQCEFICEARKNAENLMTDVFICYESTDRKIRDNVINSLSRSLITSWTHDADIEKGVQYEKAIEAGIEQADNFLLFISPESLQSEYCKKEIEYAQQMNKRILPLLVKETTLKKLASYTTIEGLDRLQYVDFTDNAEQEDYDRDIDQILNLLRKDEEYYKQHKVLLTRARQWVNENRNNTFLLRGFNLDNSATWLRLNENRKLHLPLAIHKEYIQASQAAKGTLGTDVFISYSRKDGDFARMLNLRLQEAGKTTWFDQESISSGVDFEKEIYKGIESADNIVFVISPDSIESEYCENEVIYAAENSKRFVTLLYREVESQTMPEALRKINWIDISGNDPNKVDKGFNELIQAIELDKEYAHYHTILQQRATEWEESNRNEELLLNSSFYKKASEWLNESADKIPQSTNIQKEYISASDTFNTKRSERVEKTTFVNKLFDSVRGFYKNQQRFMQKLRLNLNGIIVVLVLSNILSLAIGSNIPTYLYIIIFTLVIGAFFNLYHIKRLLKKIQGENKFYIEDNDVDKYIAYDNEGFMSHIIGKHEKVMNEKIDKLLSLPQFPSKSAERNNEAEANKAIETLEKERNLITSLRKNLLSEEKWIPKIWGELDNYIKNNPGEKSNYEESYNNEKLDIAGFFLSLKIKDLIWENSKTFKEIEVKFLQQSSDLIKKHFGEKIDQYIANVNNFNKQYPILNKPEAPSSHDPGSYADFGGPSL